jgi:hypothetical protein
MQDEIGDFVNALDEFLKVNLEGDSCLCLDYLNEKLKFLIMVCLWKPSIFANFEKMKNSSNGLSLETTDAHFKRKVKFVPNSAELLAKIKFTAENDIYIYKGSFGMLLLVCLLLLTLQSILIKFPRESNQC